MNKADKVVWKSVLTIAVNVGICVGIGYFIEHVVGPTPFED